MKNELGVDIEGDWAVKNNYAKVKVADTGSIKAGGNANLQADAKVDVTVKSETEMQRGDDTSNALPVIAVAVGVTGVGVSAIGWTWIPQPVRISKREKVKSPGRLV